MDWDTDTIKCMLVGVGYTPDQDLHDFRDDLGANEITGTNYTAGGVTLANKSRTTDAASNEVRLIADDAVWANLTTAADAYFAVIYKSRGGAASADELIGYVDLGGAQQVSAATLTIDWPATGVLKYTVS